MGVEGYERTATHAEVAEMGAVLADAIAAGAAGFATSFAPPHNGEGESSSLRLWVRSLPERQRLIVFLRYWADLDYRSIASVLEVEVGTVSATLNAAHHALRRSLEEASP